MISPKTPSCERGWSCCSDPFPRNPPSKRQNGGLVPHPCSPGPRSAPKPPSSSIAMMNNRGFSSPPHLYASILALIYPFLSSDDIFFPLEKEERAWVAGGWGKLICTPGMQGQILQGTASTAWQNPFLLFRPPPPHHPSPDLSHEKQLPVNKHKQKLGRIFKVMSYVENMFRSTLNVPVNWREMIVHGTLAFKESL